MMMTTTNNYKEEFDKIIEHLKSKNSENIDEVNKAFLLAEKLHNGQFRKSGEPYINHPVAVAGILDRLDFDTDLICAALLHDVVEDCGYTIKQMSEEFNSRIAEIVDAVSEIKEDEFDENDDGSVYDDKEFLKTSLDNLTYKKLISLGKKNKMAFYVKFADRLHNLSTISTFSLYKQIEKVKQTQQWVLPLAKMLKATYFYNNIDNLCFKILNNKKISSYLNEYNYYFESNKENFNNVRDLLFNYFADQITSNKLKYDMPIISLHPITEKIVEERIKACSIVFGFDIKQNKFYKCACNEIDIILKNNVSINECTQLLLNMFDDKKISENLKIIGYEVDDNFNYGYLIVEDNEHNKYDIILKNYMDYLTYQNGTIDGTNIDFIDDQDSNEIATNYITVLTPKRERIKMMEDSTALDFAFKIHNDFGFGFQYALINNSPNHLPPYTKLVDGDMVNIITLKDEKTSTIKNVAEIKWLAYVKTPYAQKALIKYFEKVFKSNNINNSSTSTSLSNNQNTTIPTNNTTNIINN
jgi:GTP diphosphokinase / guanosine-3',5'-bis(diphosphate) 3'-diphosphatase